MPQTAKQRILITGAWGFILSNFIRSAAYTPQPYEIIAVDSFVARSSLANRCVKKNVAQYIADITDPNIMDVIFNEAKPDIVIHGAALTSVDQSLTKPAPFYKTIVFGTQTIAETAIRYGVKRLVYLSTDQVYKPQTTEMEQASKETDELAPNNPVAQSKAEAEKIIRGSGLSYNILRLSNNYGERQTATKLIPKTIKCVLTEEKIPIYGNGQHLRDWIYVNDTVNGLFTILKSGAANETYNVGAGNELTNVEIVQRVCNALKRGHNLVEHVPDPRGQANGIRYAMDCSKLRALGWAPNVRLTDGLQSVANWYVENKHWTSNDWISLGYFGI